MEVKQCHLAKTSSFDPSQIVHIQISLAFKDLREIPDAITCKYIEVSKDCLPR